MKIAIVGSASTTKHLAPFDDESWDVWALAFHLEGIPRADLLFEIHEPNTMQWTESYKSLLKELALKVGLVMAPRAAKKFKAIPYPKGQARALLGGQAALNSSVSMMLAMAILKKPEEIGLWGVDLADDEEYFEQRPIVTGWIMVAMSRGIKITLPDACPILKEGAGYGTKSFNALSWQSGQDSYERMLLKMQADAREKVKNSTDIRKRQLLKGGLEVLEIAIHHYRSAKRGQDVEKIVSVM